MLAAAWVTAIAILGLLAGAIVTAIYAVRAFSEQSAEIRKLDQDRADQQALTRQQVDLLRLQARELRRGRPQGETEVRRLALQPQPEILSGVGT